MFGKPRPPIDEEDRRFLDESMAWLVGQFGIERLRDRPVVTPTSEFFPDPFDGSDEAVEQVVSRVAGYMDIDRGRFDLRFFSDSEQELVDAIPYATPARAPEAYGYYLEPEDDGKIVIALEEEHLLDALTLVATAAHELAHIHLLADRRMRPEDERHEPMTDLLTVFLGLGIFSANDRFRFEQFTDVNSQGWKMGGGGYLPEACYGYALALYALLRREPSPAWEKFLSDGVHPFFKKSRKFLIKQPADVLRNFP